MTSEIQPILRQRQTTTNASNERKLNAPPRSTSFWGASQFCPNADKTAKSRDKTWQNGQLFSPGHRYDPSVTLGTGVKIRCAYSGHGQNERVTT